MDNIAITFQTILAALGAITVIGGGLKYISEWLKPKKELTEKVQDMETKLDNDNERFKKMEKTLNAQSILLIEISNHLITGNDKDKLKQKADDLLECITKGE